MKKRIVPILCIFLIFFSSTAHAATPRVAQVVPNISFNGTTANCSVFIVSDKPNDDIKAVIKLWQGSQCIKTWEEYSTDHLVFSAEATVRKGKNYQLTVDVSLAGKDLPRFSVKGTCP